MFKKLGYQLGLYTEEIILAFLIILNFFDFFEMITPEWDYVDKLLGWVALGYLLYRVSLTKLFFGEKHRFFDGTIVLAYFLLLFKNIINAAQLAQKELLHRAAELISFAQTKISYGVSFISVNVTNVQQITTADITKEVLHTIFNNMTLNHPEVYIHLSDGKASRFLIADSNSFLIPFINTIVKHAVLIEKISFILGAVILILLSLYFAYVYTVNAPSLLHVIHEEGSLNKKWKYVTRPVVILLVLVGFFVIVFNLIMEWLAIAIDAPLLVIALFTYLLLLVKHHDKFHPTSFLFKMGNLGEKFYEHFIEMFHSKNGILLAVTGLLVLHLLTDVGNFLIPYLVHVHELMYFEYLGPGHDIIFNFKDVFAQNLQQVPSLLIREVIGVDILQKVMIITGYIANIISISFLLIFPAYIWYCIYQKKKITLFSWIPYVVLPVLTIALITPVFKLSQLTGHGLIGVDILTRSITSNTTPLLVSILLAIGVLILHTILNLNQWFHRHSLSLLIIASLIYFIFYIFNFFMSYSKFFIQAVIGQFQTASFASLFTAVFFFLFLMMIIIFYIGGGLLFLWQVKKSTRW